VSVNVVGQNFWLCQPGVPALPAVPSSAPKIPIRIWHRRLGHLGADNINKTATITEGMHLNLSGELLDDCRPCEIGKSQRTVSFKPQTRASTPCYELHVDIISPITPTEIKGACYGLMATCDCTRYRWGYTYKTKTEAFKHLKDSIVEIKVQYHVSVKIVRLGASLEYSGQKWVDFCPEHRIPETYCPIYSRTRRRCRAWIPDYIRAREINCYRLQNSQKPLARAIQRNDIYHQPHGNFNP
jgi:hypothetical protein